MALKKDEYICNCSDMDDMIVIYRNGTFKVIKVADKIFVGKDVLYLNVFHRNDTRTIYNLVYRDGKMGTSYIKRFNVVGVTRDKEYSLTKGTDGSRVLYFSANPNGEAETVKVILKPKPRQKLLVFEKSFSEISIKARAAIGVILTKAEIHKITLKQKGDSTLGGQQVYFDWDIKRLNYDGRGDMLGEFRSGDQILVVLRNGDFYVTNFDLSNHYEEDILMIEKYDAEKTWTAALLDAEVGFRYIKRFKIEATARKQNFIGDNPDNRLYLLTSEPFPRIEVVFGGKDSSRDPLVIDVADFIGIKGFKAKGKRISTFEIQTINELEPAEPPVAESTGAISETMYAKNTEESEEEEDVSNLSHSDLIDKITGQMKLFED
jgi:topoisomerase-4 subunit A